MAFSDPPVLQIEDLRLYFRTQQGVLHAVDNVSLNLRRNEAMVILGESGCGKTSLTRAILRLLPRNVHTYSGSVKINGREIMQLSDEEYRQQVRWIQISLVPQAAMNSLNPVLKGRRPGRRTAPLPLRHPPQRGPRTRRYLLSTRRRPRRLHQPLRLRAQRRHASARRHRHGHGHRPRPHHP